MAVVLLAGVLALWAGLGSAPLFDPDEPVYAQAGREMAARGNYLVPWFRGQAWFDKPILFYSAEAASQAALGAGPVQARLPSALCGTALAALLWLVAHRWYSRAAGSWAAIVSLTALFPAIVARAAITDELLIVTLTLGLAGLGDLLSEGEGRGSTRAFLALALGTALATLTKGPMAPVLLGAQFLLYAALARRPALLLRWRPWAAGALGVALAAPWYLWMMRLFPGEFASAFFGQQNMTRFLAPEHSGRPAWYFALVLPLAFLPWTLFAPAWARPAGTSRAAGAFRPDLFLWTWVAWVTVFFSLSATKLPTYILPAVPALCLLAGRGLAASGPRVRAWGTGVALAGAALLAVAAIAVAPRISCYYSAASRASDLRAMPPGERLWIYRGALPGTLYSAGVSGETAHAAEDVRRELDAGRAFHLLVRPWHARALAPELARMVKVPGPSGPWGEGLLLYRTPKPTGPQ